MAIAARHRHECALFDPTDETPESQMALLYSDNFYSILEANVVTLVLFW